MKQMCDELCCPCHADEIKDQMNLSGFTTFQVCESLNIKYGRLREWLDNGFIKPSIQKSNGQGSKALFNHDDIAKIRVFINLLKFGVKREQAALVVYDKNDIDTCPFCKTPLFLSGGKVIWME